MSYSGKKKKENYRLRGQKVIVMVSIMQALRTSRDFPNYGKCVSMTVMTNY